MLCLLGSKVEDRGAGGGRLRVRGVWDAEVSGGEKIIGIRQLEETERRVICGNVSRWHYKHHERRLEA